jgi:hypothetical protein
MFPADWIWQKYGLCLGWRCAACKEKVMTRSLPFKGLRKRSLEPDEAEEAGRKAAQSVKPAEPRGRMTPGRGRRPAD